MSGIREYKKEKLKRETKSKSDSNDEADDFGKRLRDHNLRRTIVIVALIIAAVVIIAILVIRIVANSYNGYTVEDYIRRTDSGYAVYMKNADGYVKFSKDGASAFTFEGKAKWNKTYEVSDMAVDQCGNYYAVANVGGNEIYVFNQDGFVSSINTALPIVKIEVSEQGLVVAILEDKEADEYFGKLKMYKDPETGMIYNRFAGITMNAVRLVDFPERFENLVKQEYVGILIHEQYFYDDYFAYEPDFADKVAKACEILLGAGFEHISMEDLIDFQD